jgi:hypothetical protein
MAKRAPKDDDDHLVSGIEQYPFDFYNNTIFYDPQPDKDSDYTRLLEAQADLAEAAADAVSRNLKHIIMVGSMSNGYLAYRLAEDNADNIRKSTKEETGESYLTTQRLKHRVAGDEMLNSTILPNRIQNNNISNRAEQTFPEFSIIPVADFEGPVRASKSNPAMSQNATFQDWTFERWWMRRVIKTHGMVLEGDHAYSRYKNGEGMTADQIQCGLLDHLRKDPGSEYKVVDGKGQDVPLADRAWEVAKHIVDVVERGFRTDMAIASIVTDFQLDDWLRGKGGKDNPIDRSKLHPVMKNRAPEELARMDQLKEIMLPYIAQKCAAWTPYEGHKGLKNYFEKNILPLQETTNLNADDVIAIKEELFAYIPRGGFVNPDYYGAEAVNPASNLNGAFMSSARAVKRRGTDGEYYKQPSKILDDGHFAKLDVWEQAVLNFVTAATEAHRLPEAAPRAAFFACEPKGGEAAKAYADKKGVDWLKEAQNAEDTGKADNFVREVIQKNVKRDNLTQETLANEPALKSRLVQNVVSTLDIHKIDAAIQKFRHGIAAKGPERLSARARLALQMEWFDRNAEILVLRKGWQYHPTDVQMAVRAVLHATGQIEKPYEGGKYRMEIFEHDADARDKDRLKKLNLHDIVKTLGAFVEKELDSTPAVPDRESYLAMARLLEIIDKLVDPGRKNFELDRDPMTGKVTKSNNEIIKWGRVFDTELTSFIYHDPSKAADLRAAQKGQEPSLRDRLRGKLLEKGVLEFNQEDLKDLDDEYAKKWESVHGKSSAQELDKDTPKRTSHLKHEGLA